VIECVFYQQFNKHNLKDIINNIDLRLLDLNYSNYPLFSALKEYSFIVNSLEKEM